MDVMIRKVETADAKTCADLQIRSWRSAFGDILSGAVMERMTRPERLEQVYEAAAASKEHHGFLILQDAKPCGMAWYGPARRSDMQEASELICIHILPEEKGKGLGSRLIAHVLADMKKQGYAECYLWVFSANEKARAFYERTGFMADGLRKSTLEAEEIMYRKTL